MSTRRAVLSCLAAATSAASLAGRARAAVSFSYAADGTAYTAAAGSTVSVGIYLEETLTGSSTDLIAADGGLTAAGAAVNATGTVSGSAASIAAGAYTAASPFSQPTVNQTLYYNQGAGNNLEFDELASPGNTAGPTNGLVLLGTLTVTVGTGRTTYSLTSLNDDTINASNSQLGQSDGNTTTLQPTAKGGTDLDAPGNSAFTGADAAAPFTFTVGPAVATATGVLTYDPAGTGAPQFTTSAAVTDFTDAGTGADVAFAAGNRVSFTDAGVSRGAITVATAGVTPAAVNVTNTTGTYTFAGGPIAGGAALTKTGTGTLSLTAANTYTGGTFLNGGITLVNADDAMGDAAGGLSFDGGTLRLAASGFASARAVALAGAGTVDTNGFSATLSGVVSGSGGLTKAGAGSLTLTANNTYSGGTTVSAGTLVVTGTLAATGATIVGTSTDHTPVLAGTGTVTGSVVVNGIITGGTGQTAADAIGTLTTGPEAWNNGGGLVVKVRPGGGNDQLVMSGLTLAGASASAPFVVTLVATGGATTAVTPLILAQDTNPADVGTFGAAISAMTLTFSASSTVMAESGTLTLEEVDAASGTGSGEYLEAVATPEPTPALLLCVPGGLLALGRRPRAVGQTPNSGPSPRPRRGIRRPE